MSVPNFSSLAGLEVPEKFMVGGGGCGFPLATVSNLKEVAFELLRVELSYVGF